MLLLSFSCPKVDFLEFQKEKEIFRVELWLNSLQQRFEQKPISLQEISLLVPPDESCYKQKGSEGDPHSYDEVYPNELTEEILFSEEMADQNIFTSDCDAYAEFYKKGGTWREDLFNDSSASLVTSIEYLYWKAWPQTLLFASNGTALTSGSGSSFLQPGRWDSGVRASLGRTLCINHEEAWIFTEYTWFKTKHQKVALGPGVITDLDDNSDIAGAATFNLQQASNTWSLSYQLADLTFKKQNFVGKRWSWSPYGGMRGAWIKSRFHTHSIFTSGPDIILADTVKSIQSQDYGIQGGLTTCFQMTPCLNFYTNGGGGLLWAHHHTLFSYSTNISGDVYDNIKASFSTLQMVFDFKVGAEYGRQVELLLFGSSYWGLRGSWEFHYWPEQSHEVKLTSNSLMFSLINNNSQNIFMPGTNLFLQGVSLRFFLIW